jgi:hypothetical protein
VLEGSSQNRIISQDALDLPQGVQRRKRVRVQKEKDTPDSCGRTGVHKSRARRIGRPKNSCAASHSIFSRLRVTRRGDNNFCCFDTV